MTPFLSLQKHCLPPVKAIFIPHILEIKNNVRKKKNTLPSPLLPNHTYSTFSFCHRDCTISHFSKLISLLSFCLLQIFFRKFTPLTTTLLHYSFIFIHSFSSPPSLSLSSLHASLSPSPGCSPSFLFSLILVLCLPSVFVPVLVYKHSFIMKTTNQPRKSLSKSISLQNASFLYHNIILK